LRVRIGKYTWAGEGGRGAGKSRLRQLEVRPLVVALDQVPGGRGWGRTSEEFEKGKDEAILFGEVGRAAGEVIRERALGTKSIATLESTADIDKGFA